MSKLGSAYYHRPGPFQRLTISAVTALRMREAAITPVPQSRHRWNLLLPFRVGRVPDLNGEIMELSLESREDPALLFAKSGWGILDAWEMPLLRTKLYLPPARPEWVPRPRLIERLDAGLEAGRRVTLIAAPAGFGKTSLVSDWFRQTEALAVWLSLDEADNDLVRFLTYLIAALQDALTEVPGCPEQVPGQRALEMLHVDQPQAPPTEVVLTALINDLAVAPSVVLVLDDYHLIETPSIHEALTFLLDHAPPSLHLVVITRADPPLPIARLRGRGQLNELRQDDLRFNEEEAVAFLNQAMELDLAPDDIAVLETRTEGWIVGLQLAALSLQGRTDRHAFITAFSGGHHYVLEYLADEVVRRQPERIQRFLVQTSILDRLSGALCDAVTGESDSAAVLADLQHRNLFIVPLDAEHRWYRYHHLFADLLGNLLRREVSPERIRELYVRASVWYEQHDLTSEAVRHALAAPDFDRAAALIERYSLATVMRGELATLLRWISSLPDDVARSRPWLLHSPSVAPDACREDRGGGDIACPG